MDAASQDIELTREQDRLFNFLKKYDLQQYYSKFLLKGVHRLTHLKGVLADEASLDEIGLSRIERMRLRKKVKENVAWKGKIVVRLELTSSVTYTSWVAQMYELTSCWIASGLNLAMRWRTPSRICTHRMCSQSLRSFLKST